MISALHLSTLALAFGLASASHLSNEFRSSKRHHARVPAPANVTKRGDTFTGRGTWFNVGLGACGQYSQPSDMIVALNYVQYGDGYPGPNCFRSITIEYNGVQQVATIMDECPEGACDSAGQLDMSTGLFQVWNDLGVGEITMTWWFNDAPPSGGNNGDNGGNNNNNNNNNNNGDNGNSSSSTSTTDSSTSTTTTTTSTTSTTSTTTTTTTTSTTTTSSATSTTSTATSTDSGVTGSGTPTTATGPTNTATAGNNMVALDSLVVAFGEIVVAGGHA